MKTAMKELIEWMDKAIETLENQYSLSVAAGIRAAKSQAESLIDMEPDQIKELEYHRTTTVGLWATDRPDLIPDNIKDLFFEIK